MVRRKLTLNTKDSKKSVGQSIRGANISITFEEFFNLHEKYIQAKTLQGLASRTLVDYKKHMNIFKEYIEAVKRIDLIRYLDIDVFYEYDVKGGLINIHAENAKTRVFRTVPISPKTAKLLKELINISSENDCEYVFQSSFGGRIDKMVIIKNFTRYGKRAGLSCRTSPHVFRHTFATNFIKAGGDVFTLQRIMGHAELSTTRKYIQLDNTDLIRKHKQVSMIDKLI